MIAKIYVNNPSYVVDSKNNLTLNFGVKSTQIWAIKEVVKNLENNTKDLVVYLDYNNKDRTLLQNSLLWGLLTEEALFINGNRKDKHITAEQLYYKAINDYGKDTLVAVKSGTETDLKRQYKRVFIIDKFDIGNGEIWSKCRCVIGSSDYTTNEMKLLIDGVIDDIIALGADSENIRYLRTEWEECNSGRRQEKVLAKTRKRLSKQQPNKSN